MWLAGLVPATTSPANVGAVVWQPPQSPLLGWAESKAAEGLESPAAVLVLAIIPRYGAAWWQVWQLGTAVPTVLCPDSVRVGALILADPRVKPPVFRLAVVWQPDPLQSSEPIGM
jgi:hypothetical protein